MHKKIIFLTLALCIPLASCASNEAAGTVSGATLGALAGTAIAKDDKAGIIYGSLIGGVIGNRIGHQADLNERGYYDAPPRPRVVYQEEPTVVVRPRPRVIYQEEPSVIYRPRPRVIYVEPRRVYSDVTVIREPSRCREREIREWKHGRPHRERITRCR